MSRIILFSPKFFGYGKLIKQEFESKGHEVFLLGFNINSFVDFILSFVSAPKKQHFYSRHIQKVLESLPIESCDYFIMIRGMYVNEGHLNYIESRNNSIRKVMYQWDSVRNFDYLKMISFFDITYTFDIEDSKKYGLSYLPLFYTKDIKDFSKEKCNIDILYIATYTEDRYLYFLKLHQYCQKNMIVLRCHLATSMKKRIELSLKYNNKNLSFKPLKRDRLIELYKQSKIFVDITSPNQSGLSMRIIECFGANKKLITSNKCLKENPRIKDMQYICSDNIESISELLELPIIEYEQKEEFSITSWSNKLLRN